MGFGAISYFHPLGESLNWGKIAVRSMDTGRNQFSSFLIRGFGENNSFLILPLSLILFPVSPFRHFPQVLK